MTARRPSSQVDSFTASKLQTLLQCSQDRFELAQKKKEEQEKEPASEKEEESERERVCVRETSE